MPSIQRLAPLVFLVLGIVACSRASSYKGDGVLVDSGRLNYSRRYVLDLGSIDLTRQGEYAYRLEGLPHAEFVIGIRLDNLESNPIDAPRAKTSAKARIELINKSGATVVLEDAPLLDWVWSGGLGDTTAFLYRRGDSKDTPLPRGDVRVERINVGPSDGWGSYFSSGGSSSYTLLLRVTAPDASLQSPARLILHGW